MTHPVFLATERLKEVAAEIYELQLADDYASCLTCKHFTKPRSCADCVVNVRLPACWCMRATSGTTLTQTSACHTTCVVR